MKLLLGVCNHNISQVSAMCRELKVPIHIVSYDLEPNFDPSKIAAGTMLLIPTVRLFTRLCERLNAAPHLLVSVFDAAPSVEMLEPIKLLDVEVQPVSFVYRFRRIRTHDLQYALAATTESPIVVKRRTLNLIPTMLNALPGSVLQHVLTYCYTVSNTDERTEQQSVIYKWLFQGDDVESLKQALDTRWPKRRCKARDVLADKLSKMAEPLANLRRALSASQTIRQRKVGKAGIAMAVPYNKLAIQFSVDAFDLRYLMRSAVVDAASQAHTVLDKGGYPQDFSVVQERKRAARLIKATLKKAEQEDEAKDEDEFSL